VFKTLSLVVVPTSQGVAVLILFGSTKLHCECHCDTIMVVSRRNADTANIAIQE
jgi:hypothetical protein